MKTKLLLRKNRIIGVFTVILGIVGLSLVFQGCEKDDVERDDVFYKLNIPKEFNQVGKLHNQGLNHVFRAIKQAHIENMEESATSLKSAKIIDYQLIISEATLGFCKTNKILKNNFKVCESALNIFFSESIPNSIKKTQVISDELNPAQQKYYNQIVDAINSINIVSNESRKLKLKLDEITRYAAMELEEKDIEIIFGTASTAYYSYNYWLKNYRKWYFALNFPEILQHYNEEQLNNLAVKNGEHTKKGTTNWIWNSIWNQVENWWDSTYDAAIEWWEEDGQTIVASDAAGFTTGALLGLAGAPVTAGASVLASGTAVGLAASAGACVYVIIE